MIRVRLQRSGGISETVGRIGGEVGFVAERIGGDIRTATERVGGMDARACRIGGIMCRMYQEVRSSVNKPYLEITPTIVWVLAGWTSKIGRAHV